MLSSLKRRCARRRDGQLVLVTGAASGLGLELTTLFLKAGATVVLTDLHAPDALPEPCAAVISRAGGRASYRQLDVTSDADWAAAADAVRDGEYGERVLDVLVSNAGIAVGGRIEHTSMETWQKALDINLLGGVRAARSFVPLLRDGGQLVFTASAAGLVSSPGMTTYNATKAATVALAETLSAELSHRRIAVTAICPQFFQSGLKDSLVSDDAVATKMADALLTKTWLTAAGIARRAMLGIDTRRLVVAPDGIALVSWYSKRFTRPGYLAVTRMIGRGVAKQG
ncbi:SDR family NAD(P)-dependent oxidoreductase [Corynebacterium variabile]|uniref:SDR family NAD(P)-dependent oxidoreductase n=1 Tax=Corynebacterium variabile TaxID=1727 RepID=UPI003A8D101A